MISQCDSDNLEEAVGYYVKAYNQERCEPYVAKILSVDTDNEEAKVHILSGKYKGHTRNSKFVPGAPVTLFDEDTVIKALVET